MERALIGEISHWQQCLAEIGEPRTRNQKAMCRLYGELITCRRRLLAAIRDGRPENWLELAAVSID